MRHLSKADVIETLEKGKRRYRLTVPIDERFYPIYSEAIFFRSWVAQKTGISTWPFPFEAFKGSEQALQNELLERVPWLEDLNRWDFITEDGTVTNIEEGFSINFDSKEPLVNLHHALLDYASTSNCVDLK